MGGETETTKTNKTGYSNLTGNQTLSPYGPAAGGIDTILGNVAGINPNLGPAETGALNRLSELGQAGSPYAGLIGANANRLLTGGGATDYAPLINQGLQQYETGLAPFLDPKYLDPRSNPHLQPVLDTLTSDISNNIRSQFGNAGRSFSGYENQTLGRGLAQGLAPALLGQYNTNVATQLGALGNRFNAVTGTGRALTDLGQLDLTNRQAGVGMADAANQAQMWGPQTVLAAEAARRGIPLGTLAQQMGITLPAAQAFGTQNVNRGVTDTSTQEATASKPFNPWSLLPLAFAPFTGGASLAALPFMGAAKGSGLSFGLPGTTLA